jgi:uncharacterized protein (TIGR03083 family)
MKTTQAVAVEAIPSLHYDAVMDLAATEVSRILALAGDLQDDEWEQPTDCALWTVRDVLGHLLGMWQCQVDPDERARQMAIAEERRAASGRQRIDELTGLQVELNASLSYGELVDAMQAIAPAALAARRGLPEHAQAQPYDSEVPGEPIWTMGYLLGTIHTRDPWMHRIDICRATGREIVLTPDHDGRIVSDVVREWCPRHRTPLNLHLTGPAGGEFMYAGGGEDLTADAVDFCRVLSGRGSADGPMAVRVTF